MSQGALGKIMEAEFHYDFESPPWLKFLTQKEYTPGSGLAFGLGQWFYLLPWLVELI